MNKLFVSFLMIPFFLQAQKNVESLSTNTLLSEIKSKAEISSYQKINFNPSSIEETTKKHVLQSSEMKNTDCELRLINNIESPIGFHLFYQQYYKGLPIYDSYIKINVNKMGEQLSSYNHLYNSQNWNTSAHANDASKGEAIYIVSNGNLVPAYKKMVNGIETVTDKYASNLFQQDLKLYFSTVDTMVTTKVFMPDPLTSAKVSYYVPGTYKNFKDSDYALLNDQRFSATFPATLDGDTFRLKNKYCRITDMSYDTPDFSNQYTYLSHTPTTSLSPDFTFTRGKDGFKDAMAMYHIYNYQQYLNSIGIHNAVNWQIKVDPIALTADQSYFLPGVDTAIYFGMGGVPDAEDADVITHEYTHAIRFSIVPQWPSGNDRWAVEEGICDIMAALYSKAYSDFKWRDLYNWDGHNEYWAGRDGNSINGNLGRMKKYSDIDGYRYHDCDIWTACILDMYDEIGREKITKLLFTMIYSLTPYTTMPEAAKLFMQADSILYGKYDAWRIGKYFNQRELGSFSEGVNDITNSQTFKILNTAGFAEGSGDAVIETIIPSTISVYTISGKKIIDSKNSSDKIILQTLLFEKGFYFITIENAKGIFTSKITKF